MPTVATIKHENYMREIQQTVKTIPHQISECQCMALILLKILDRYFAFLWFNRAEEQPITPLIDRAEVDF